MTHGLNRVPAAALFAASLSLVPATTLLAGVPPESELQPGVTLRTYQSAHTLDRVIEPAKDQTPNEDKLCENIDFATGFSVIKDNFVADVLGYLKVDAAGEYELRVRSDDGAFVWVDGKVVLKNDGEHPPRDETTKVTLDAGLYTLRVLYFDKEGGEVLKLLWKPPGAAEFVVIPNEHLRTEKDVTRVVAPGPKRFVGQIEGLRPGDGLSLESVHPSYRIETIRPETFDPMVGCMTWLPDGRLLVGTFEPKNNGVWLEEPNGTLWALSNLDAAKRADIKVERFADGFHHPLGLCVQSGDLYIAQRDEITRMRDADGDGVFETRGTFANGWKNDNYHHFTFGLAHDAGHLYATLSTSIGAQGQKVVSGTERGANGPNPATRGTAMKISLADGSIEYLAGGLRTPNGMLMTSTGKLFVGENQGAWMPSSKINWIRPGRFYGHYNETRVKTDRYPDGGVPALYSDQPITAPVLWLPQNEICNSPTDIIEIPSGEFSGQFLVSELKMGGIRRVFLDEVNGELQGGVVQWSQGFEGGINRLLWGPGGTIIVGCMGEQDTWSWRGTRTGLQRLVPTGEHAFEIHSVRMAGDGFEVKFTEPVDPKIAADVSRYTARRWGYRGGPDYGGPKVDEENLTVTRAQPSRDGRTVRLSVANLVPNCCVYLRCDVPSQEGKPLWATEAWYTINALPDTYPTPAKQTHPGTVLIFSKTAGFRHDSIPEGIECMRAIARDLGLEAIATEDASVFTDTSLADVRAIVFLNTTGDVLDLSQEAAMERCVKRGAGFVGIHAAADTEYDWPWYMHLVGAAFKTHPAIQRATINVVDASHPATSHLSPKWERRDEWYDFQSAPGAGVRRLLSLDEATYQGGTMGKDHPIAWCREEAGLGRSFYTAGGHTKQSYSEPDFVAHLKGGLEWVLRRDSK